MTSPHGILRRLHGAEAGYDIPDPGDAGTISVDRNFGVCQLDSAAAETRTLPIPTYAGCVLTVQMVEDGGDITLTVTNGYDQAGNTTIVLDDVFDFVTFVSVYDKTNDAYEWRVLNQDGTDVVESLAEDVSIADTGGFTTATDVEAALAEIYQHVLSAQAFLQLPFSIWRDITSNDIQNLAAHGGILCKDSTPILEYTNGDTDSQQRVRWASSDVNPISCGFALPPDMDRAADMVLHFYAEMSSTNDTPAIDLDTFFNKGDTKVSDSSAALSDTLAEVTITVAAADIPAGALVCSLELTPAAHGNDAIHVYGGFWLEYTRKILTS